MATADDPPPHTAHTVDAPRAMRKKKKRGKFAKIIFFALEIFPFSLSFFLSL
jgi:hypothetical protein